MKNNFYGYFLNVKKTFKDYLGCQIIKYKDLNDEK